MTTPVSSKERDYFWTWRNSNKDTPQHVTKISEMNVDTIVLLDKYVQMILERRGMWAWLTMNFQSEGNKIFRKCLEI